MNVTLGDATVDVRYSYERAEAATHDDPGAYEDLEITGVLIGDEWVGTEFFSDRWLVKAAVSVLKQIHEDTREGCQE